MTSIPISLERGCVFRAEHDASYEFWKSTDARWKRCLAFNSEPADAASDVHYFLATSKLTYFRENPHLLSEVMIFSPHAYSFFPEETAIDFRDLHVVPFVKLRSNGLQVLGHLTPADVEQCEATIRGARLLPNRDRRRLNLLD
jgi:hypothetical protein